MLHLQVSALLLLLLLLLASPVPAQLPEPRAADFNFDAFSAACANGSAAVRRWAAMEAARIRLERLHGANTLASAPARLDAAGCVREPGGGGTRLPLDVMVDSHYYAARLFVGQFQHRRANRSEVLDALAAEIWSNLLPRWFHREFGLSQMLTVRQLLSGSGWYPSYDHSRFAHDVYHFYHRRWRGALLAGLFRDEDGDGCLSLAEYGRSLCLQQRYMDSALRRTGQQTRALRRVVTRLRMVQRWAA